MISELLAFFRRNLSLICEIIFVSYKDSRDIVVRMLLNFIHPVVNRFVRLFVSCVIHDNNSVSSFVVGRSNRLESLLTCSVPNLEFDCLSINLQGSDLKVDSNCGHEVISKCVVLSKS